MIARQFRVQGRVQGVGFRWATQEQARSRGLAGWVRNEDDGTVTGFVQGENVDLERFHLWLNQGPRGASVALVEWREAEATGLRLFSIR